MCTVVNTTCRPNAAFVPAQLSLQPDEVSASPDPKTSPRLSRASIFLTQILQVRRRGTSEVDADTPPATVDRM